MKFSYIIATILIALCLFEVIVSTRTRMFTHSHSHTKKSNKYRDQPKANKKRPISLDIPDASIYWQGWVKYYHYTNNTHYEKPPSLFQNNAFYHQRIIKSNLLEKDKNGALHIPNKASFYFVLYKDSIGFYSNRKDIVANLVDTLKIEDIEPIPEDKPKKGGVRNDGEFGFGSCIEIESWLPTSLGSPMKNAQTWIICTNTDKEKFSLMNTIIKLKVKKQREENNNMKVTSSSLKTQATTGKLGIGSLITNPLGEDRKAGQVKNPADGYWVILQDWTLCNKKCGGGLQFQQWMCVPPKNDGLPCKGPAVKTRKCNEQACPSVNALLTMTSGKLKADVSPKPIIKVGQFSNRPQRYSKCFLKENDAFIVELDPVSKIKIKKPIRIVMNNYTISIFRDDTYEDLAYTFDLDHTSFTIKRVPCCFSIQDGHKKIGICSYDSECDKQSNNWVLGWQKDFKLFKVECKTGLKTEYITSADEEQLEDKMNNDLEAAVEDNAATQAIEVKKSELAKKARIYAKKTKETQEAGFKVLSKEIELEDMVQGEESEKEEIEQKKMEQKIVLEKQKAACLEKSFEEKQLDDEFIETEKASLADSNEIKMQTAKKIEEGRWKLRKKIALMKAKAKAKSTQLAQELNLVRSKMSKDILLANRNGDYKKCQKGMTDTDYRETYCNEAFTDDWYKNGECKSINEFCYVCCENEFGLNFVTQRDNCYDVCDKKQKPKQIVKFPSVSGKAIFQVKQDLPEDGHWQWAPKDEAHVPTAN